MTTACTGNDSIFANAGNDTLYGGDGNDTLGGSGGHDVIWAGSGNDTITGGLDNDTIYGEEGNDTIWAGAGDNVMDGGDGIDMLSYSASIAGITVDLSAGIAYGSGINDVFSNFENVLGTNYADTIIGDEGNNSLNGLNGNDMLIGGDGNDSLTGGQGNDLFVFGHESGVDTISGFDGEGLSGGDIIQIASNINGSGIVDFATLSSFISYASGNATINLGNGHSIFVTQVTSSFNADDFAFV
jgi:Ca2+-binding RTX toxin-like protein